MIFLLFVSPIIVLAYALSPDRAAPFAGTKAIAIQNFGSSFSHSQMR